jgi:hypothetical protein
LRPLLADRCLLVVHTETKARPIYTLALAHREDALKARGTPIAALARMLSSWVEDHREVWDETTVLVIDRVEQPTPD